MNPSSILRVPGCWLRPAERLMLQLLAAAAVLAPCRGVGGWDAWGLSAVAAATVSSCHSPQNLCMQLTVQERAEAPRSRGASSSRSRVPRQPGGRAPLLQKKPRWDGMRPPGSLATGSTG